MTYRRELREGWLLFRPYAVEVVTPRRLATLLVGMPLVSIVVAALVRLAFGTAGSGADEIVKPTLTALAAGLFAGSVVSWILLAVWRPRLTDEEKSTGTRSMSAPQPQGAEREIRLAFAEGREPNLTVAQRLSAADAARRALRLWPRVILGSLGGTTIIVSYAIFVVASWPHVGALGGFFSIVFAWWSVPAGLVGLARTVAPLETAPEVPPHLREDDRKRPLPRKSLGTDHPDDYS